MKISEDIRRSRYTTCINDTIGKFSHRYRCFCWHRRQIFRAGRSRYKFRKLVQQIANSQICRYTKFVIFVDLPHVWQFANLQFALRRYSGAWGKQIYDKQTEVKFSWHCPFKLHFRENLKTCPYRSYLQGGSDKSGIFFFLLLDDTTQP